jgi:hypothetical protein
MKLIDEINLRAKEIHTDGYPMSIGEIASLYKDGELDIHPEFQRIFRWTIVQKSKLIESIFLGIPIPSVFVSQRDDGVWDVVDGLQRLSTIFEFMGLLKDEKGDLLPKSQLVATEYLPSLAGKLWEDENQDNDIGNALRMEFKRVKLDIKIVKKQSDKNVKYELFQRINTLGTSLSDQEVRNCLLIMVNKDFYIWIKDLANYEPFISTTSLADRLIDEQYHIELALRFFIYKNINLDEIKGVNDLADFVTKKMLFYADEKNFDKATEAEIFKQTFNFISEIMEDQAFKRYNPTKKRFEGQFLLSAFECIGIGIGKNIESNTIEKDKAKVLEKAKSIWTNPDFQNKTGSGVNVSSRLPGLIPLGTSVFKA